MVLHLYRCQADNNRKFPQSIYPHKHQVALGPLSRTVTEVDVSQFPYFESILLAFISFFEFPRDGVARISWFEMYFASAEKHLLAFSPFFQFHLNQSRLKILKKRGNIFEPLSTLIYLTRHSFYKLI